MARIKLSAIVSDIRGKLNGSVFQLNNGVLSMRNNTSHINSKSQSVENTKVSCSVISAEWCKLSDSNKAAWYDYANIIKKSQRNSVLKHLGGQSLFSHINYYRNAFSESVLYSPVGFDNNTFSVSYRIIKFGSSLFLYLDREIDSSVCFPFITLTHPVQPSRNYGMNKGRRITFSKYSGQLIDITADYQRAWGFLCNVGDTILLRSIMIDAITGLTAYDNVQKIVVENIAPYDHVSNIVNQLYSCRVGLSSYTGRVFEARRVSDGATRIFMASEVATGLNTVLAWAGLNYVWINKLYNQANDIDEMVVSLGGAALTLNAGQNLGFIKSCDATFDSNLLSGYNDSFNFRLTCKYRSTYGGYIAGLVDNPVDNYFQHVFLNNSNMVATFQSHNEDDSYSTFTSGIVSGAFTEWFGLEWQKQYVDGNTSVTFRAADNKVTLAAVKKCNLYLNIFNDDGFGGSVGQYLYVKDIVFFNNVLSDAQSNFINLFNNL